MATLSIQQKRNDNTPDLINGRASDMQTASERSVIFTHVLKGLGVPRQVQRFIWILYTISKPGLTYQFNDFQLAEHLGCAAGPTSRTYPANLRKKLREWNNGSYDSHGTKHFSFVSVQENNYDPKTKKQNPTGYLFSEKFAQILDELHDQVRRHNSYKTNWILAIREVCATAGRSELTDFGFWNERKEKRPRRPEDIIGTLLLNYKRLTRKIVDLSTQFGMSKDDTAEFLLRMSTNYIREAQFTSLASNPTITIKQPGGDPETDVLDGLAPYGGGNKIIANVTESQLLTAEQRQQKTNEFWNKVLGYVFERESPAGGEMEFKKYVGNTNGRNIINGARRNGAETSGRPRVEEFDRVESRSDIQLLPDEATQNFMVDQRQRFLENRKRRGGVYSGAETNG